MTISASGSCKYHDAVLKRETERLCGELSPSLESCGLPAPLEKLITGYAVELPEDLCCMTITQIEAGGEKAAAVAMRYLDRCGILRILGGFQWRPTNHYNEGKWIELACLSTDGSLCFSTDGSLFTQNLNVVGEPDLPTIERICKDTWVRVTHLSIEIRDLKLWKSVPLLRSVHDRYLDSAPQGFKDRICFHTLGVWERNNFLPDAVLTYKDEEALKDQLQKEQAQVAREIGEASKKA